jgi:hypothetical protein
MNTLPPGCTYPEFVDILMKGFDMCLEGKDKQEIRQIGYRTVAIFNEKIHQQQMLILNGKIRLTLIDKMYENGLVNDFIYIKTVMKHETTKQRLFHFYILCQALQEAMLERGENIPYV